MRTKAGTVQAAAAVPQREAAYYRDPDEREEMVITRLCEGSAVERLSEHGGFNPVIHKELRRK